MDAIEIRNVRKTHGDFVLDDVELVLPAGHVAGFVGPNGAGKTTTLKALLGLAPPDAGLVRVLGGAPDDPAVKDRIGVVLDGPVVAPEWRVDRIGSRIGRFWTRWDEDEYRRLLDRFGLPGRSAAGGLSKGQSLLLALALALAHHPDLLVLDEPSSGLDPVARADLADLLRAFVVDDAHSVLFSTHITADLDGVADFLHVIVDGRIVLAGELDDLRERFAVARGTGAPPPSALAAVGLRVEGDRWDALIDAGDTAAYSADTVIDPATTDDLVVHLARRDSGRSVPA